MTDSFEVPERQPAPAEPEAAAASSGSAFSADGGAADDRPEVPVGAAFAGGFLLAMVLKRLAR